MTNANNNANLIGRLASEPKAFPNADGSKKVVFTLYAKRNYKNSAGVRESDEISVEAFLNNKVTGLGPYEFAHTGDLVALTTHIEQKPYTDKATGKKVFPAPKVAIDDIEFLESATTTNARLARRAVAGNQGADAAAPAVSDADKAAFDAVANAEAALAAAQAALPTAGAYDNDAPFATTGA